MKDLESPSVPSDDSPSKPSEKEQEQKNLIDKNVEMVPPDGGWGWMVVAGSFLIFTVGTFPLYGFSIILSPILMSGRVSSTKTAWIFNFNKLIRSFYAIFIGPLCEQFGTRKVAIFGGVASFLSLFLSAFAPTVDYLFITYALPAGIAEASTFTLSFMVVSSYFKKHRGFVIGITSVGGCLSTFITPILANFLLENYGYVSAAVIFGAFALNQCVGASLYQPVKWHMKPAKTYSEDLVKCIRESEKTNLQGKVSVKPCRKPQISSTKYEIKNDTDKVTFSIQKPTNKFIKVLKSTFKNLKSLKYMRVHLLAWSYFGLLFGLHNFRMWMPFVITSNGHSLEMAAWWASLSSIGNLIGKISMSLLADRKFFNVIYGLMFGQFLMGISIIACSLVNDITHLMIVTSCFGFSVGFSISSFVTVMIEVMGIEMLPAVLGVSSLFKGLAGIIFGPLTGAVRDATQSYANILWMLASFNFMGFLMLLLIPFGAKFDNWNMRRIERKRSHKMAAAFF
ncbi:UNVERIFIED_CONTAM: hypothetical protein RMT77_002821 [Armadillidium vulgare]